MIGEHRLRVDQSAEFAELVAVLGRKGPGGAVVLGGSGMGKTSLVQAALARPEIDPPVMRLHCSTTLSAVPYGALSPYLSSLERVDDPVHVLREINTVLSDSLPGQRPPTVVVEDAQFLDPESSFVLSMLVENAAIKLIAIGSGRIDGESTLFSLTESGLLSTIVVQPFDVDGVRFLAQHLVGGRLTNGTVEVIRAMTGGNPSLVKAYVQSCLAQDVLVRGELAAVGGDEADAPWILARLAPEPDEGLMEVVREMHSFLPAGQQHTLELLALGGPQPRALLVACVGSDYRHLLESGILVDDRDGLIRVRAEIHSAVLRHIVAPGRSAELHNSWDAHRQELGLALTPLQVLWAIEVSAAIPADVALAAVETANNQLDYPLAWKLCAVAGLSASSEQGVLSEGQTLLGLGRYYSARAILTRLAEATNDPIVLQRALNMLVVALNRLGLDSTGLDNLDNLWRSRAKESDSPAAFTADTEHSRANELLDLWRAVQDSEGPEWSKADVSQILANPDLSTEGRTIGLMILSDIQSVEGRTETALGLARQAMVGLDQNAWLAGNYQLHVLFRVGWNLVYSGRYAEAEEFLAQRSGTTVRSLLYRYGTISLVRGIGQLLQGQSEQALDTLAEAIAELRLRDPSRLLPLAITMREFVRNRRSASLNRGKVKKSRDRGKPVRLPFDTASGFLGDVEPSRRLLARAVATGIDGPDHDELEKFPLIEREVIAFAEERLHGDAPTVTRLNERLGELAADMEGPRAALLGRLAAASKTTATTDLQELARDAIQASDYQIATEAMARAANHYSEVGDNRSCGTVLRELMELLREHQLTPDPYVARALAMAELTSREEEIVELARKGKNNAEIAKSLTVSQRTVEGHLYRVFSKLGINDRSDLMVLRLFAGTSGEQNA